MIAIPIIIASMMYITLLGYIQPKVKSWAYDRKGLDFTNDGAQCFAFFTILLLPLFAPFCLGLWLSKNGSEFKDQSISRKQAKEIAAAKHKQEVARINAETLALKEREAGIR